jgi:1,2-diacylglycerol 3-alpha-glucosyltransferase
MKVLIVFINVGYYHIARINSLAESKLDLEVLQLTNNSLEHPWGTIENLLKTPLFTIYNENEKKNTNLPNVNFFHLDSILKKINPDAIFVPGWGFDLSKKILKWSKNNNTKCYLMSESKFDDKKRNIILEFYKSITYIRKFHGALVGGHAHKEYLISLGMKKERIQLGYDIVDNKYFQEMTTVIRNTNQENNYPIPQNNYFICVTRFIPRKNIKLLLHAYHNYKMQVHKPWDLVICGTGIEHNIISSLIEKLDLNKNVHLPGFVSYSEIVYWYASASCLVHPALSEQWGLVINEACASSLPIICSDKVGACNELVVEGMNGFKFNPSNSLELTNCLINFHQIDKEKIKQMGVYSNKIVNEKCSALNFKNGFLNLLNV